jgi:hypothetical protein
MLFIFWVFLYIVLGFLTLLSIWEGASLCALWPRPGRACYVGNHFVLGFFWGVIISVVFLCVMLGFV